VAKTINF